MRRLGDQSEDSPDEMTELLKSQGDGTPTDGQEVFESKLIIKNTLMLLFVFY